MEDNNYPALYGIANDCAIESQRDLLNLSKANFALVITASALTLFSQEARWVAVTGFVLFLGALFLYIYTRHRGLHNIWYQSRALAESIKTSTWRYMMKAPPFNDGKDDDSEFIQLVSDLLRENRGLGSNLASNRGSDEIITGRMLEVRDLSLAEKIKVYSEQRIKDQRHWYKSKAMWNKKLGRRWFWAVVLCYSAVIALMIWRMVDPKAEFLPIEVFVVCASCAITWIQTKRFEELSSAYALTAIEIGVIQSQFSSVSTDDDLSNFVANAENAFSREHTQWLARKDHGD